MFANNGRVKADGKSQPERSIAAAIETAIRLSRNSLIFANIRKEIEATEATRAYAEIIPSADCKFLF